MHTNIIVGIFFRNLSTEQSGGLEADPPARSRSRAAGKSQGLPMKMKVFVRFHIKSGFQ